LLLPTVLPAVLTEELTEVLAELLVGVAIEFDPVETGVPPAARVLIGVLAGVFVFAVFAVLVAATIFIPCFRPLRSLLKASCYRN
jgi:hypothetical protein